MTPDKALCAKCKNISLETVEKIIYCTNCGAKFASDDSNHNYDITFISSKNSLTGKSAVVEAVKNLKKGKIVAIKGIGGYHLACLPTSYETVKFLREIKQRYSKPLAVMFRDVHSVKTVCSIAKYEENLLKSIESPIILVDIKAKNFAENVLYDSNRCGCFLPYTLLHLALFSDIDSLVMTSANTTNSPIIYDDEEMRSFFNLHKSDLFVGILQHSRQILRPIEDSVAQFISGDMQILRRARGYVPKSFIIKAKNNSIALGGDLKSCFCITKDSKAVLSQFFGDLENDKVLKLFEKSINDWIKMYNFTPDFLLADKHPNYYSKEFGKKYNLPLFEVQHHHAHIASVAAEHGIYQSVIGIAFDGTGYGDDNTIWGGEFFVGKPESLTRVAHLEPVSLIGGDEYAKDSLKTASAMLSNFKELSCTDLDDRYNIIKAAIKNDINTHRNSSIGRLFDAVAAITGICKYNSYEGECAIKLQEAAEKALKEGLIPLDLSFDYTLLNNITLISYEKLLTGIYKSCFQNNNVHPYSIALGFHIACADMISYICSILRKNYDLNIVLMSGGVFQNRLLTSMAKDKLSRSGFVCFTNNITSPNDSSIALGQAYIGGILCV